MRARVRKLRLSKAGILKLSLAVEGVAPGSRMRVLLRHRGDGRTLVLHEFEEAPADAKLAVVADLSEIAGQHVYWDLYAECTSEGSDSQLVTCTCPKSLLAQLAVRCVQYHAPNGMVVIPYVASGNALAFICREWSSHDSVSTRVVEYAALIAATLLAPLQRRKGSWLVYEKFCMRAQDNGFVFFKYCMEELPPRERRRVFFVIDKSSPDYGKAAAYGDNVLEFMSFRHLFHALGARLYVASEASFHLYQWRSKPSLVKRKIKNKPVLFLQHGVTALKRVDGLFGRDGLYPMTYFLTTSKREQSIVVDNFGYKIEEAPVLGFARWDALEDTSQPSEPLVLVAPTWRPWLDGMGEAEFRESEYFAAYFGLLGSPGLHALLEERGAKLKFYLHPRLAEYAHLFDSEQARAEVVHEGDVALNELIMECSVAVTDYSSVAWDVAYLDKPVLFYQFDAERYLDEIGSYIDFGTDLPGRGCPTLSALEEALCTALGADMMTDAREWFEYRDKRNCERIYRYVKDVTKDGS